MVVQVVVRGASCASRVANALSTVRRTRRTCHCAGVVIAAGAATGSAGRTGKDSVAAYKRTISIAGQAAGSICTETGSAIGGTKTLKLD